MAKLVGGLGVGPGSSNGFHLFTKTAFVGIVVSYNHGALPLEAVTEFFQ